MIPRLLQALVQRRTANDRLGAMPTLAWACLAQGDGATACARKREHGTPPVSIAEPCSDGPSRRLPQRNGFSLLEVVLAMALFFGAAAVLSQLLMTAMRTARFGEGMTEAALRCESKMAELASGAISLESRDEVPFADDADWEYSLDVVPTRIPALVRVTLSVAHRKGEKHDVEVSLARLFADPETLEGQPAADLFVTTPQAPLSIEEMLGLHEEAPDEAP